MEWKAIESAPRDGTPIILYWPSWAYELDANKGVQAVSIGRYYTNHRIERMAEKSPEELEKVNIISASYFSDQNEDDCYGQAQAHNYPTHWMHLPKPPAE